MLQRAMLAWLIIMLLVRVASARIYTTPSTTYQWVDSESNRETVGEISVTNGGSWGEWKDPVFCPDRTFAVGYRMKANDFFSNSLNICHVLVFLFLFVLSDLIGANIYLTVSMHQNKHSTGKKQHAFETNCKRMNQVTYVK